MIPQLRIDVAVSVAVVGAQLESRSEMATPERVRQIAPMLARDPEGDPGSAEGRNRMC